MSNSDSYMPTPGTDRVYLDFYSLKEAPFSITPDPQFLFLAKTHQNAIDKLDYAIKNRMGFIVLTGEVGTGKTTICRYFLDQIDQTAKTVYIINPSLSGKEIIISILDDIGITYPCNASKKDLIGFLNNYLLSDKNKVPLVIVIDDAQTMSIEALEQLRLLSNLETDKEKYIQMILVGQPEFIDLLSHPDLRQLKQRVAVKCHLDYLTREETEQYILRRIVNAGDSGRIRFAQGAVNRIFKFSKGTPRLINKVCEYVLTAGYVSNAFDISSHHVKIAMNELEDLGLNRGRIRFFNVFKNKFSTYKRAFVTSSCIIFLGALIALMSGYVNISISGKQVLSETPTVVNKDNLENIPPSFEQETAVQEENPDNGRLGKNSNVINSPIITPVIKKKPASSNSQKAHPYILQLASFRDLDLIKKELLSYKERIEEINWQHVENKDNESWYRLISGRFKTLEEAKEYKNRYQLTQSIIHYSPWTVQIGQYASSKMLVPVLAALQDNGMDGYVVKTTNGQFELRMGTFKTLKKAQKSASKIEALGLSAKPILQ